MYGLDQSNCKIRHELLYCALRVMRDMSRLMGMWSDGVCAFVGVGQSNVFIHHIYLKLIQVCFNKN